MKVLQLFAHFTDEQYRLLTKEHKDEIMIKIFLTTHLSKAIKNECERIKEEDFKTIDLLDKETKL